MYVNKLVDIYVESSSQENYSFNKKTTKHDHGPLALLPLRGLLNEISLLTMDKNFVLPASPPASISPLQLITTNSCRPRGKTLYTRPRSHRRSPSPPWTGALSNGSHPSARIPAVPATPRERRIKHTTQPLIHNPPPPLTLISRSPFLLYRRTYFFGSPTSTF